MTAFPHPSEQVYEAIRGLRVVRRFQQRPVSDADRGAILDAARWTGSSKNRQSWAFVVLRDRDHIAELAEHGDHTAPLKHAPLAIAPIGLPDAYDWDLGRASQNLMLAAAARGVGSCPITLHRDADARPVLGIPDDHTCRFVIALGYPDVEAERDDRVRRGPRGRRPLETLVYEERFGS
jgi:nitroreductase